MAGATRFELATSGLARDRNPRRSGIDPKIRVSIMGHWLRGKDIAERYGRISDQEFLDSIDTMKFENGNTEI